MNKFRHIVVLFILFGFSGQCNKLPFYTDFQFTNVKKGLGFNKASSEDTPVNQFQVFKRKYKSKGLLVIVPHVPKLYFLQDYIYNDFFAQKTINNYSCSLHYVQLKRGPPVLKN